MSLGSHDGIWDGGYGRWLRKGVRQGRQNYGRGPRIATGRIGIR
jgi:hypothetical protein